MDRFDKSFNDIDPVTSRPFSSGHPDGIWLISIIYSLPIAIPIAVIIFGILFGLIFSGVSWSLVGGMVGALFVYSLFFMPIIILMFRRSVKAIYYALFLFALLCVGLLATYIFAPESIIALIAAVILQGYICCYLYGLKKDLLLNQ